ncbi:MAG: biotin/lipoyl-containing protein [Bacteroidota bacterium]
MEQLPKTTVVTWPEMFGKATVSEIRVRVGQTLNPGAVLLEAESDDATIELEVYDACEVTELKVIVGQTLSAHDAVAVLEGRDHSSGLAISFQVIVFIAVIGLALALIWLGILQV